MGTKTTKTKDTIVPKISLQFMNFLAWLLKSESPIQ